MNLPPAPTSAPTPAQYQYQPQGQAYVPQQQPTQAYPQYAASPAPTQAQAQAMPPTPATAQPSLLQQPDNPEAAGKMGLANILTCVIGLLLFLVYATAMLLFTGVHTPTAFISMGFALVAFVLAFLMPKFAVERPNIEAVFFGIPMIGFAVYYFVAEVFISAVFIFFQQVISWKIALFAQLVILVAFVIISIVSFTAQRATASKSEERRQQAVSWGMQTVDIGSIIDTSRMRGADDQLMDMLDHLNDTAKYSDAFGRNHPAIVEVEGRINMKLAQLRDSASRGDFQSERAQVQELEALYAERSRKLMLIK